MIVHETKLRVLYADTDQMGYAYYGNYAKFYEFGRTEAIRSIGFPYAELEKRGVAMPVIDMSCKYFKPARYDDLITIKTIVKELPASRIYFDYEILNEKGELLNTGKTTLIFLHIERNRPVRIPDILLDKMRPYFENA